MKNRIFGYLAFASVSVALVVAVINISKDAEKISSYEQKINSLETAVSDFRASDSLKGDSIRLLTAALSSELEYHCDTMTATERLKFLEFQRYEVKMWTEREKAITSAYTQKEKAQMSAYTQKEKAGLKIYTIFAKSEYQGLKILAKKNKTNFNEYVMAKFWNDNAEGEEQHQYWERLTEVERLPDVKEYIALENKARDVYTSANNQLDKEYSKKIEEYEQSYEAQIKELELKYENLINEKKISLGL